MEIKDNNTILLEKSEVLDLCKPGEGDNTCIWLMVSSEGFECSYYNRPNALVARWSQGKTVAKRNGCNKIKELNLSIRCQEAKTLEDVLKETRRMK